MLQFEGVKRYEVWLIQPATWSSVHCKKHGSGRIWTFVEQSQAGIGANRVGNPVPLIFQEWQVEFFVVLENVQFEKTCCFKPELVKLLTAWHHITTYKKDIIGYQATWAKTPSGGKKTPGKIRQTFLPRQKIWKQEVRGIELSIQYVKVRFIYNLMFLRSPIKECRSFLKHP